MTNHYVSATEIPLGIGPRYRAVVHHGLASVPAIVVFGSMI